MYTLASSGISNQFLVIYDKGHLALVNASALSSEDNLFQGFPFTISDTWNVSFICIS